MLGFDCVVHAAYAIVFDLVGDAAYASTQSLGDLLHAHIFSEPPLDLFSFRQTQMPEYFHDPILLHCSDSKVNLHVQIILLIPSVLLHVWVLKFAEGIAEAIAYFRYRMQRGRLANTINELEMKKKTVTAQFMKMVQRFVEAMDAFERSYPGFETGFARIVPHDLACSVNVVMGRNIFDFVRSRDSFGRRKPLE